MSYEEALARGRRDGASHCDDAALMAAFCATTLQIVVGAVSPKLVWEGAQKKQMTAADLAALAGTDPAAVAELMWVDA